jgi:trigger factor
MRGAARFPFAHGEREEKPIVEEESPLKTEVTKGDGHQVTLKVEAGPEDMEEILERTYKDLSSKVKVAGFRKGKVPRAVIDSHLGADYVRAEAIKGGMPTLYVMGIIDSGISPVSDPEINILDLTDDGGVVFEAKVDVRPEIEVKDYFGLEVDRPDTEVTEEDMKEALTEARDRFATLEVVEGRPVEKGDFVLFDYKVFTDGVPLEGSSGSDRMTEVGSGDFLQGFDEQLVGTRKGDIVDVVIDFPPDYGEPTLAGKPATFRTMVKEIKRKVLPELDDDLAKEVSSYDTLDEFKEHLKSRIANVKLAMGERSIKDQVVKALIDKTYIDLPDSMIEHQVELEIEDLAGELAERGITLEQYLDAMKGSRHQLEKAVRERVTEGLKAELVVDAVARAEDVDVSDEEVELYIRANAAQAGGDPDAILEDVQARGRIHAIKANLRLNKAVELLAENAVFKGGGSAGEFLKEAAEEGAEEADTEVEVEASKESEPLEGEIVEVTAEDAEEESAEAVNGETVTEEDATEDGPEVT